MAEREVARRSEVVPPSINPYHLPAALRGFAEVIGVDGAMKLVGQYGGTHLYIPLKVIGTQHPLAALLGQELAAKLARHCGGESFDIPKAQAALSALRHQRIRADRAAGKKVTELARHYNLTERQIRNICN